MRYKADSSEQLYLCVAMVRKYVYINNEALCFNAIPFYFSSA